MRLHVIFWVMTSSSHAVGYQREVNGAGKGA